MDTPRRRRQKTNSACQRCRQRKLGCDRQRPCILCVRAQVECIPRQSAGSDLDVASATPTDITGIADISAQPGEAAVLPESSIINFSSLIFSSMSLGSDAVQDTSALPGGHKVIEFNSFGRRSWREIVGIEMPDDATLIALVDRFFNSVDWFIMVFHEPSFRQKYQALLAADHVPYHEQNVLWLFVVVVALGAHYQSLSSESDEQRQRLQRLTADLMDRAEAQFLRLVNCATLEAVQICILMGSYLLFSGRPNVGIGISGAGVKVAQVISLHRESKWRDASPAVRETKRRTWWALEVFDKYLAIAFGRPCTIDDSDCSVGMITDIGANSVNPLLRAHQYKFRLYRIVGQFLNRKKLSGSSKDVRTIHEELNQWKESLPSELRMESYSDSAEPSIVQMQAMALQLTYDNIQIILHRTVAFEEGNKNKVRQTPAGAFSLHHLTEASLRTAELHKFSKTLQACRYTHANMHVGITLFTAGVVLCIVCLAQPLSAASQRAKTSIMHIISICKNASDVKSIASRQSMGTLERLVSAVLQLENRIITGQSPGPALVENSTMTQAQVEAADAVSMSHQNRLAQRQQDASRRSQRLRGPPAEESSDANIETTSVAVSEPAQMQPEMPSATIGLDWDNLSLMMDAGFADASQMWLWADQTSFDEPSS